MSDIFKSFEVSASAMQAQAQRIRHVTENIANADTPGYRRKITSFENMLGSGRADGLIQTTPVSLDKSPLTKIYDPSHPLADESGHFDGSNVNLVVEIADAREAQRSYEANLKMFDQARQMSSSLMELLRR